MKGEERREKSDERQRSMSIPRGAGFSVYGSWFTGPSSLFPLPSSRRYAGFTLVEIMVVLFIIMILSGLIVGGAKYALTKAARSRAEAEIAAMENALENYKIDNGVYPTTPPGRPTDANGPAYANSPTLHKALAGGPGYPKTYLTFKPNQIQVISPAETNVVDPFGKPYNYYCTQPLQPDQMNSVTFDLWSYGPDNADSTPDDITNWKH